MVEAILSNVLPASRLPKVIEAWEVPAHAEFPNAFRSPATILKLRAAGSETGALGLPEHAALLAVVPYSSLYEVIAPAHDIQAEYPSSEMEILSIEEFLTLIRERLGIA